MSRRSHDDQRALAIASTEPRIKGTLQLCTEPKARPSGYHDRQPILQRRYSCVGSHVNKLFEGGRVGGVASSYEDHHVAYRIKSIRIVQESKFDVHSRPDEVVCLHDPDPKRKHNLQSWAVCPWGSARIAGQVWRR